MFLFGSFLKCTQDVMTFASPLILRYYFILYPIIVHYFCMYVYFFSSLISFVENATEYVWRGYLYAFALFIVAVIQTLVLSQYFHRMFLVGLRIRTALISTIYRKALRLSNSARKESTVGEIVNLMAVDAQRYFINFILKNIFQSILYNNGTYVIGLWN